MLGCIGIGINGTSEVANFGGQIDHHVKLNDCELKNADLEITFEGFLALFIHNVSQDLSCLIGGLFLAIPSLFISFINATNFISLFVKLPFPMLLFGILPHGIFEIPSSIFALAGALMLFNFELNILKGIFSSKTTVKEKFNESECLIKDAIITAVIVIVLLFIAALIENYITPVLLTKFLV